MSENAPDHGYTGRILTVDMTERAFRVEPLSGEQARAFIGGRGLGAALLYELMPPGTEPLDPAAPLIFATGPLTGTRAPTSGRFSLTGRSPLTRTVLDTNCGGAFGARLKSAGYDALILHGASDELITLEVDDRGVHFLPAAGLAGREVHDVTSALLEGRKAASAAVIGSAGERLVSLATIMVDGKRALGRGGMGAVMGSKNLKAIVVQGSDVRPKVAHPEDLEFFLYEIKKTLAANPITSTALPRFGTAMLVGVLGKRGLMPSLNYRGDGREMVDALSGERLADEFLVSRSGCWGCPIVCGRKTRTGSGEGHGPEYETIWALGANLGITSLEDVVDLNYLCNELGLDTISVGGTLAVAIELAENGAELPVRRGDTPSVREAILSMARRDEGFGDLAASGSLALALAFDSSELAMQVKGLELPAYDPRGMQGQGLGYATSNRGGCHLRGNMLGFEVLGTPKLVDPSAVGGKAGLLIVAQHLGAALDSLSLCKFSSFALSEEHYARLYSAVTGFEMGGQELLRAGERIWNLERLFNLREGFSSADDRLPTRLLEEPNEAGEVVDLAPMLAEYYRFRGWDEFGVPTRGKLDSLGLVAYAGGQ